MTIQEALLDLTYVPPDEGHNDASLVVALALIERAGGELIHCCTRGGYYERVNRYLGACHWCVYKNGRFYDHETPNGVLIINRLPFYVWIGTHFSLLNEKGIGREYKQVEPIVCVAHGGDGYDNCRTCEKCRECAE